MDLSARSELQNPKALFLGVFFVFGAFDQQIRIRLLMHVQYGRVLYTLLMYSHTFDFIGLLIVKRRSISG